MISEMKYYAALHKHMLNEVEYLVDMNPATARDYPFEQDVAYVEDKARHMLLAMAEFTYDPNVTMETLDAALIDMGLLEQTGV